MSCPDVPPKLCRLESSQIDEGSKRRSAAGPAVLPAFLPTAHSS
eukprot:CAMPEP_0194752922 /NCGR_PEP_ID=MMETSP0323_2-20130528/6830_1 /TAXON_ID=2866 ORGANISM="Crypthecodinium cohnii, Strain Seligo" /NCGR_SAMPLE_ID=MMETSP0323_2 /ASSEMBLY_ACC=CAM_ASM_000346 /LENGTH=43 /DNA_ID= /DNA_START= /DNA_END= /DNA_ORIENTATION=